MTEGGTSFKTMSQKILISQLWHLIYDYYYYYDYLWSSNSILLTTRKKFIWSVDSNLGFHLKAINKALLLCIIMR